MTRRNQWGQYLVVPPGQQRGPVGYARVTTIAKTLDDGGGLIPWKATATVVGKYRRPGLAARWEALLAANPDPWYASRASKDQCKALVEECAQAGGSTDRADIGTAEHAIIEQLLRNPGGPPPILQPNMKADIDAFLMTTTAAGIQFDPNLLEAMVVLDAHRVAGSADHGSAFVPGVGNVISDLKTGTDLQYSWQSIAVQLAAYANADNVYVQGEAADGSEDLRLPMPDVSKKWGMVIHLPAGEARCDLYLIDLVAGWDAFERSMWTRQWRQRKTLARLYTPGPVEAPPTFDEPTVSGGAQVPAPAAPPDLTIPDFDASVLQPVQSTGAPAPATGQPAVESARPTPTPPPFDSPQPDLATERTLQEIHAIIGDTPDDGEPGDDAAYLALQTKYAALEPAVKAWFAELTDQSVRHRCSFHSHGARTVRRFEIIRGLTELAAAGATDDETLRCVLAGGPEPIIDPTIAHDLRLEPGHLLGSLDAARAALFAHRAGRLASGGVPAVVDEATGRVVLDFAVSTDLAAAAA